MLQLLCFATEWVRWINCKNPHSELGYILTHFSSQPSCHAFNSMGKYVIASQMSHGCKCAMAAVSFLKEPNACKGWEKHASCEEQALS